MDSKYLDNKLYNNDFMRLAIDEAMLSEKEGGIPIGSVLVKDNYAISKGHNKRVQEKNALLHAEIVCLDGALKDSTDLSNCTVYTTNMPCFLCSGAIVQFGVSKVVAGESKTFPHARRMLEENGVEVVDLDLEECKTIASNFTQKNDLLWANASNNNCPDREQSIESEVVIPYKKVEDFNFYQYPIPLEVPDDEKFKLPQKLRLDEAILDEEVFTLFASIPYCQSKCNSCLFYKNPIGSREHQEETLDDYLEKIVEQIENYSNTNRFKNAECKAIYLGGGTASLLSPRQVNSLIKSIKTSFHIDRETEITFEANPAQLTHEYMDVVDLNEINRVSIGLQSFNDETLKCLNSPHNGTQSLKAMENVVGRGIKTINVDLLYGIPGQEINSWNDDVEKVLDFEPKSITTYRYKIFPGSRADILVQKSLLAKPKSDDAIYEYKTYISKMLKNNGYIEDAFGSFVKKGHEQKYRRYSYQLGCESIGIGAGAYSYINGYLFRTSENVKKFKADIDSGLYSIGDYISKRATQQNKIEKYLMNNLYALHINRNEFNDRFGCDPITIFPETFAKLLRYKLLEVYDESISVTDVGKKHLQNIMYEFYLNKSKRGRL